MGQGGGQTTRYMSGFVTSPPCGNVTISSPVAAGKKQACQTRNICDKFFFPSVANYQKSNYKFVGIISKEIIMEFGRGSSFYPWRQTGYQTEGERNSDMWEAGRGSSCVSLDSLLSRKVFFSPLQREFCITLQTTKLHHHLINGRAVETLHTWEGFWKWQMSGKHMKTIFTGNLWTRNPQSNGNWFGSLGDLEIL